MSSATSSFAGRGGRGRRRRCGRERLQRRSAARVRPSEAAVSCRGSGLILPGSRRGHPKRLAAWCHLLRDPGRRYGALPAAAAHHRQVESAGCRRPGRPRRAARLRVGRTVVRSSDENVQRLQLVPRLADRHCGPHGRAVDPPGLAAGRLHRGHHHGLLVNEQCSQRPRQPTTTPGGPAVRQRARGQFSPAATPRQPSSATASCCCSCSPS